MQLYKTEISKALKVPTQLDYLHAAYRRDLLQTRKEVSLYQNLARGAQGERYVMDMLQDYGCSHWIVIPNLWQEYFGVYETDILLITNSTCYSLEVKNYDGNFEYKEHRCFINGKKLKENCIQQAEKSYMNLREICGEIDRRIIVKGALLFVGEHSQVTFNSEVDDIKVVTRQTLRNFIREIAREESRIGFKNLNIKKVLTHFEKNEVLNPFGPLVSYTPEEVLKGKRGIYCDECGSYDTELTRKFLKCKCEHVEPRNPALLRTIHEFGVLTFQNQYMTRAHLMIFMDNKVSSSSLVNLLNQYFLRVNKGRHTKYKIEYVQD